MQTKNFFKSKINWASILLILVALLPVIEQQNFDGMTIKDWVLFAIGAAIIVLRTFFTNTNIKTK